MPKRVLIYDDSIVRRWQVFDDEGEPAGVEEEPYPVVEQSNAAALREKAAQALAVNAAYLTLPTPTAAQTTAQVQRLTRQVNALVRLATGLTDSMADT